MTKLKQVKEHLQRENLDGWLLYDFQGSNELARTFLEIPKGEVTTRRFFYWIPLKGDPVKLVHAVEPKVLHRWPGEAKVFSSWNSLQEGLKGFLKKGLKVAMEYSPDNAVPYLSKVDAGTIDFVRSLGVNVKSSGSFVHHFTSTFDHFEGQELIRTGKLLQKIVDDTWKWIEEHLLKGKKGAQHIERLLIAFLQ